jgi:hypothetical protein
VRRDRAAPTDPGRPRPTRPAAAARHRPEADRAPTGRPAPADRTATAPAAGRTVRARAARLSRYRPVPRPDWHLGAEEGGTGAAPPDSRAGPVRAAGAVDRPDRGATSNRPSRAGRPAARSRAEAGWRARRDRVRDGRAGGRPGPARRPGADRQPGAGPGGGGPAPWAAIGPRCRPPSEPPRRGWSAPAQPAVPARPSPRGGPSTSRTGGRGRRCRLPSCRTGGRTSATGYLLRLDFSGRAPTKSSPYKESVKPAGTPQAGTPARDGGQSHFSTAIIRSTRAPPAARVTRITPIWAISASTRSAPDFV